MKNAGILLLLVGTLMAAFSTAEPTGVQRHTLLKVPLEKTAAVTRIEAISIKIPVSGKAPPHSHPCPVIGQILEGAIRYQIENQPERILHAGDAFLEPADTPIMHFDNVGNGPARFVALYLAGTGDEKLIRLLP